MYNDNYNSSNAPRQNNNRSVAGIFLVALGVIYLLRQLDWFFFPHWLFSWPMILIAVGVLSGIKHNFQRPGAYVMIAIGSLFLIGRIISFSLFYFWPVILIAIGVSMLMGRDKHWFDRNKTWHNPYHDNRVDL